MKKLPVKLSALVLAALLSACAAQGSGETDTEPETLPVITIETEAEEGDERIIAVGLNDSILPSLENVTTAEDNARLAPAELAIGQNYPVVQVLQARLMGLGYMDNDEPTTYYGEATAEAVRYFQRQQGLPQSGICDVGVWDQLFDASAPYYKVRNGDSGNDIVKIQERLYELGYILDDSFDGKFGDMTEAAVKKLQERNDLKSDGTVGKATINLLYSDEVKANLIGLGEQSDLVKHYQQRLKSLGYLHNGEEPDGNFGQVTERAVREFQSRNDQVVDGYLGPSTRMAMDSSSAKPFGLRLGDRSDSVRIAQRRLVHYGYLSSNDLVTGYFGELTEAAVKAFQRQNSLTQDGTVGIQTMTKLESSNARKKPAEVVVQPTQSSGGSSGSSGGSSGGSSSGGSAPISWAPENVSGQAATLISIASSKLGSPYVWGSKGPNSFDCSGFVYYCLNQAGVSQSYLTSSGWRNPGRYQKISNFDEIRAGDIVVVSGHVGIAAGNGEVIDASSSNGRVVHRTLTNWWRNNFYMAWRVF